MTETQPWYANGLTFSCTGCGNCCTGSAGFTWVSEDEIDALAARLGMDRESFSARYTRVVWRGGEQRVSLSEKRGGDCVFWQKGEGCTVYEQRPRQCRTWPFWRRIVDSPEDWAEAGRECPGINHGALHPLKEIAETIADDGLP